MFRILVVEDNADMRELFCTVLSDSGYACYPAADGLEALEIMDREYIDLIVADIMMPGMDGYALTAEIRAAKMELPILMVTAKDQFGDMQKAFHAGTDDYMIKPINVKELVLRVEALLRRAKIQSEKKITVGSTVLDYNALTVTIHGEETILPQKEFICCTSSCLTRTRSSPVRSSWTKSGGCFRKRMNARSTPTSTGCATVFPTARILRSSPCADLGIRR